MLIFCFLSRRCELNEIWKSKIEFVIMELVHPRGPIFLCFFFLKECTRVEFFFARHMKILKCVNGPI